MLLASDLCLMDMATSSVTYCVKMFELRGIKIVTMSIYHCGHPSAVVFNSLRSVITTWTQKLVELRATLVAPCGKVILENVKQHGGRENIIIGFQFDSDNKLIISDRYVTFCMEIDHKYVNRLCITYCL
jgi:hypothetical protein